MILKMINFDWITIDSSKMQSTNWSYIPGHPYRKLIIGCSRSGETNALLNSINHQADIDEIFHALKIHDINCW